jgi:HemY protein
VTLLIMLGSLCADEGLWGKANDYLERSLRVQSLPKALIALAQLAERNGNIERAHALYREAALQAVDEPRASTLLDRY